MVNIHPYQEYIGRLEKKHSINIQELIRDFYIVKDKGPSVTARARDLGIPRNAVLHFISEYNLSVIKHRNIKESVYLE